MELLQKKKTLFAILLVVALMCAQAAPAFAAGSGEEASPFADVDSGAYYYAPVLWAVEKGITTGTSDTTFSPDVICTRAEIITFLWRAAGSPEPETSENPFDDVTDEDFYCKAALWAREKGMVSGPSFGGLESVNRAMTVQYLWQAAGSPAVTAGADFSDVASDAEYAQAVAWAVKQDVTEGTGDGAFSPDILCTRGQIVTFLYRDFANGTGTSDSEKEYIESALNLANNEDQEWTYSVAADAWVLSVVTAVAYPEVPNHQGVSVCVPGAYVTGIDTNGDGTADVTAEAAASAVKGGLVIDYDAQITSTNGQTYTAATAPVILNTGAMGYGSQNNSAASTTYAAEGYINISCGNRGKQDTATDESGNTYYTGDAPSCLVDQKAAARFVKYNILLGNLPGNVDYFVSTGGSGGGAHATMFAATSNNPDFYDYQIEAGAVGVYKTAGGYSTTVTIDGQDYELSDGAWGCIAYSAITSLYEADMALAFEYYMDTDYDFNTPFQAQLAEYLSAAYMEYINGQDLSVKESDVGFDLNGDGDKDDTIALTIEYDLDAHPETNGYYGSYLDLYLAEFTENLQWYLDNLDYSKGWTWFDENGSALSDEAVAAMSSEDKAEAFLAGRYAKGSTGGMPGGPGGMPPGGPGGPGGMPGGPGGPVGTPGSGTTQSSTGGADSANYATYADMVAAYKADVEEVYAGDAYGKNIVSLYNPLNYIGAENTEDPTWTRIVMGAAEGDMSMFSSLNLQIAWLNADVDAVIEWQWNGGHVPSEVLGNSFALCVDQMYGKYVSGAAEVVKPAASAQTENGTATEATGTNLSGWVNSSDVHAVSFTLADAAAYRTAGAAKATPGFDVIDYGQEDYVFGSRTADARHWNKCLVDIFEEHSDVLEPLFNGN